MKVHIDRCICYNTTFEEMKSIMCENNIKTIDELRNIKPVSLNCKICLPYILKMIETGETEFNEILT